MTNFPALALFALFVVILWRMYVRHYRQTMQARAALLSECTGLLTDAELIRTPSGFARLVGRYDGYRVEIDLEADHAAMRKIPSLWMHLSVSGPSLRGRETLDILVRPQNTEFYSPSWNWEGRLEPLPGWPQHADYRTLGKSPDPQVIDAGVKRIFADERAKELVLTPKVIRLTYQAKQANRGDYLILRGASFDAEPVPANTVRSLLQQALDMRRTLEGAVTV